MLDPSSPALVLAPMDGITDAPMRALMGELGAFSYAVTEFLRVSIEPLPMKVFKRDVPELANDCRTITGLPVQVQLLGGHPDRLAITARTAVEAGAKAIDLNFGCPAPTVNRNDGGASLLLHPTRIRDIVGAVRDALPPSVPVSAKLRLGWDCTESIHQNAQMAAEGGANWITIHARTRLQGYAPPVYWEPIGEVRSALSIPVVANGDIWTLDDFLRCQGATGCSHYMIGRSALANPDLPGQIARELGLSVPDPEVHDWPARLTRLVHYSEAFSDKPIKTLLRLKQWVSLAARHGDFPYFHEVKRAESLEAFFVTLSLAQANSPSAPSDCANIAFNGADSLLAPVGSADRRL